VRFLQVIAVAWLALAGALSPVHAEKRVALVIGNDRYVNLPANEQLQKAVNDARAVGGSLQQIGFDVISGENLDRRALLGKFDELVRSVGPGDVAFFFFSGHGVAFDGVNYILPTDVPDVSAGQETRLKREALDEPYIISELASHGVRVSIVVLDACRTNPFSGPGGKGVGGAKGLAPPPQVQGVFSLYAASSGQTALDRLYDGDPNPNSVFSRVLAPMLKRPGLDLRDLAYEVREEVARIARTAGNNQRPEDHDGTVGGRVYLAGPPPVGGPPVTVQPVVPAVIDPGREDLKRQEDLKRKAFVSSTLSTGWKLTGKNFVFGSRYTVVNSLLDKPFSIPAYDRLPRAGEYDPDEIRYFWVRVNALSAVQSALRNLAQDNKCIDDPSYIVFFFKNGNFFRISLRLHHSPQCHTYQWVRDALFSPGQNKLSLTGSKGNVSLIYHEDDLYSALEIVQSGIAREDDGFFGLR
jgi:hypothetical protein